MYTTKELLEKFRLLLLALHIGTLGLAVLPESPTQKNGESMINGNVVVLKDSHGKPSELHLLALRRTIVKNLKNALAENKTSVLGLEQIAWCQKTSTRLNPPMTIEELVILANIKVDEKPKYLLCFLERIPLDRRQWRSEWHFAGHRIYFVKPKRIFNANPGDEQIEKFLVETNFGNREFRDDTVVGTIVCFESRAKLVNLFSQSLDDKSRDDYKEKLSDSLSRRFGQE